MRSSADSAIISSILNGGTRRLSRPALQWRSVRRALAPRPEVVTTPSPAPPVVVECWCLMVATRDSVRLDKFTRETWKKFDAKDLETLKWAILGRRRVLACPVRP